MVKSLQALMALLLVVFLAGVAPAQEEKKGRGEKGERGERAEKRDESAKKVSDLEVVISEVGDGSISYQFDRKGKVAQKVIGIADVTRIEKIDWKPIKIKDLQPGDKALITVYEDPEDPYFPALSVRVMGKGEVQKVKGGGE